MNKRSHVLTACFGLLFFTSLFGQTGFKLPSYENVHIGDTLDFPVTVVNFDSVFAIQFLIKWNPEVLAFRDPKVDTYGQLSPLNLNAGANFNLNEGPIGQLRFQWSTQSPKSVQNTAPIFTIKMKVVGEDGTATQIKFDELFSTIFEVLRIEDGVTVADSLSTAPNINGLVTVGDVVIAAQEPGYHSIPLKVSPNPFTSSTTASFDLAENGWTRLFITDIAGKICAEKNIYLDSGRNGMEIANSMLHGPGMYFLHLISNGAHAVQPIVSQ